MVHLEVTEKFLLHKSKIMKYLLFINLSLLCNPQFADTVILNCLDHGLIRVCIPQGLTAGHCHDMGDEGGNSLRMASTVYCSLRLLTCFAECTRFSKLNVCVIHLHRFHVVCTLDFSYVGKWKMI